jgi:ornithine carbamoyltransferase
MMSKERPGTNSPTTVSTVLTVQSGYWPVGLRAPLSHPNKALLKKAREIGERTEMKLSIVKQPRDAATGADVLYTDVLVSMGQEKERQRRMRTFRGYQINSALLKIAADEAVVMRCIPAHRGPDHGPRHGGTAIVGLGASAE